MGHCYVHLAFVFTLMNVSISIRPISLPLWDPVADRNVQLHTASNTAKPLALRSQGTRHKMWRTKTNAKWKWQNLIG